MAGLSAGCDRCSCYARGLQDAAWATYSGNVATTAARELADRVRQTVKRWSE